MHQDQVISSASILSFSCSAVRVIARQHQLCTKIETLAVAFERRLGQNLLGTLAAVRLARRSKQQSRFLSSLTHVSTDSFSPVLYRVSIDFFLRSGIVVTKPCQVKMAKGGCFKSCFTTPLSTSTLTESVHCKDRETKCSHRIAYGAVLRKVPAQPWELN